MTTESTPPAAEVVRSEERLRVGTTTQVRAHVRLRKRIVTEEVTQTVRVSREVLDIEELPVNPSAPPVPASSDWSPAADVEIVLHEERVVINTVVVPVERIRIRVEQITEQVAVTDVVRREEIEVTEAPTTGEHTRA